MYRRKDWKGYFTSEKVEMEVLSDKDGGREIERDNYGEETG